MNIMLLMYTGSDRLIALYTATEKPDVVKKYTDLRATFPAKK